MIPAEALRALLAESGVALPVTAYGLPYDDGDDPALCDRFGRYVAQTVYDMQSVTQELPVDARTRLIAEALNALPGLLDIAEAATALLAARDADAEGAARDALRSALRALGS